MKTFCQTGIFVKINLWERLKCPPPPSTPLSNELPYFFILEKWRKKFDHQSFYGGAMMPPTIPYLNKLKIICKKYLATELPEKNKNLCQFFLAGGASCLYPSGSSTPIPHQLSYYSLKKYCKTNFGKKFKTVFFGGGQKGPPPPLVNIW